VAAWTEADIVTFLKTGIAPAAGKAVAPMAESVHGLGNANDDDLQAIAAYLKAAPAGSQPAPDRALFNGAQVRGGQGYLDRCAACHGLDGKGLAEVIPALAGNAAVNAADPGDALKAVLGGRVADGTYAPMAAVGAGMTDDEVADVVNFVRQAFGNAAAPTATPALAAELRKTLNTPMNPTSAAACTPIPLGPIASGINQPLSGIPAGVWTVDTKNPWPRLLALADRVDRYIPMATTAQRVNILTGIYCQTLLHKPTIDPVTRAAMIGTFSQQMYSAIRDYPLIREHAAQ
jgi:mono/diheme cytochrome c family protein